MNKTVSDYWDIYRKMDFPDSLDPRHAMIITGLILIADRLPYAEFDTEMINKILDGKD